MSLSTRRPPGIPSSVRPPRSASVARGRGYSRDPNESPSPTSASDNKYRTQSQSQSQRSRSVPRQAPENPYRSRRRAEEAPPLPHSSSSRHSVQSSVSSSSSGGNSVVSAASTAPSSIWDYVGLKSNAAGSGGERGEEHLSEVEGSRAAPVEENSLWSRVAAVAGGLSINVSKAWDGKDDLPEPDTPPGHDSRVTTALKKHYIKQVSDVRQLPAWLFSDIERQVGRSAYRTESASTPIDRSQPSSSPSSPIRARARHEDAYVQPQTRERVRTATYDEERTGPTRAATRLRALRDARRVPVEHEREAYAPPADPEPMREPERAQAAPAPAPVSRPRVGLPPRPGRIRRE